jgi:hypothetical protein
VYRKSSQGTTKGLWGIDRKKQSIMKRSVLVKVRRRDNVIVGKTEENKEIKDKFYDKTHDTRVVSLLRTDCHEL